jgi:hypothetical protein
MKRVKKENVTDALERHVQNQKRVRFRPTLKASDEAVATSKRGRPHAFRSRVAPTFQSLEAATYIVDQMRIFREQNSVLEVPRDVRDELWERAHELYPMAVQSTVTRYIQRNREWFDDGDSDDEEDGSL